MAERTCPCGATFSASSHRARFCSDRCRKRESRRGVDAKVIELQTQAPDDSGPLESSTRTTLTDAGKVDHPLGVALLTLARRLDQPGADSISSISAGMKQFEAMLATLTRGQASTSAQALQDELAARRARHA
jgi:endogenous inhibitor of DNA gyrase (YacG/DUF329 family)